MPRDKREKLSEPQWREAADLYGAGFTTVELGAHFGMTPEGVSYGLKKRGYKIRHKQKRVVCDGTTLICTQCNNAFPATEDFFYSNGSGKGLHAECKPCFKKRMLSFRESNREIINQKSKERYRKNPEPARKYARDVIRNIRSQVLDHYGNGHPCCVCCGEEHVEFLTIDHINRGGTKHREEVGYGSKFYRWLIRNGFPSEYRILCMNCNFADGVYGRCPHSLLHPVPILHREVVVQHD